MALQAPSNFTILQFCTSRGGEPALETFKRNLDNHLADIL